MAYTSKMAESETEIMFAKEAISLVRTAFHEVIKESVVSERGTLLVKKMLELLDQDEYWEEIKNFCCS